MIKSQLARSKSQSNILATFKKQIFLATLSSAQLSWFNWSQLPFFNSTDNKNFNYYLKTKGNDFITEKLTNLTACLQINERYKSMCLFSLLLSKEQEIERRVIFIIKIYIHNVVTLCIYIQFTNCQVINHIHNIQHRITLIYIYL